MLTEELYQQTLEGFQVIENALNQSCVVAITNRQGVISYVNDKFCQLSKYSADELIGQTHSMLNSGYHPKSFFENMWRTISGGKIWLGEIKNLAKDGSHYWVNTTIIPSLNSSGKPYQYIAIRTDITESKKNENALQIALKNDFRQTVKNLQNAVFKYTSDQEGKILFTLLEGHLAEELGLTLEMLCENKLYHSFSEDEYRQYKSNLLKALSGEAVHFEIMLMGFTCLIYLSPIFEASKVVEVVGTAIDITERKRAEKIVENMAYYDYLTGLANRMLFKIKVKETIAQSRLQNDTFGIMFLDLNRFKGINDTLGHTIGDQLLIEVGERLENICRIGDVVARYGGDEFVILLPSTEPDEARSIATNIVDEISRTFTFDNLHLNTSPSIGISMFPQDGEDSESLISNADLAMYVAKVNEEKMYHFFTQSLARETLNKEMLKSDLKQALSENQFIIHYQPQINLKSGKLSGLEALIRWQHPSKGIISPADFIPIAEETGLIVPIGKLILETVCSQAVKWQRLGFKPIRMNVNVSVGQLNQITFVKQVEEILYKTGLHPAFLNLEITESMTIDVQKCRKILQQLRNIGVSISIDDFGTGYSSLSYISEFPITHLKIDQTFIHGESMSKRAIVKTIVALAKNLNIKVIAEGVETIEQAEFLKSLNCDEVQGYLYSKPVPKEQIEQLLKNSTQ
ncbi:sensor domain-containing protein [Sporosarcina sp. FA9]|uniref:sensor domain-containing protein n=1 Tax=Sporosarcina sp. FA9 TaxID=3413030 RepID=UPI003F65B0DC